MELTFQQSAMAASQAFQLVGGQGQFEAVGKNVAGYVNVGQLKYYFTVDTNYVKKKIKILFLPFLHKSWERSDRDGKIATPRDDVNAPDLYIPTMAFVTYILVVGLVLGTVGRFSPEQLGIAASSALGWMVLEVFVCYAGLYLLNIASNGILELAALSSYKYVGMIVAVLAYLLSHSWTLFYCVLGEACFAQAYFFYFSVSSSLNLSAAAFGSHQKKQYVFVLVYSILQACVMAWTAIRLAGMDSGKTAAVLLDAASAHENTQL